MTGRRSLEKDGKAERIWLINVEKVNLGLSDEGFWFQTCLPSFFLCCFAALAAALSAFLSAREEALSVEAEDVADCADACAEDDCEAEACDAPYCEDVVCEEVDAEEVGFPPLTFVVEPPRQPQRCPGSSSRPQ